MRSPVFYYTMINTKPKYKILTEQDSAKYKKEIYNNMLFK